MRFRCVGLATFLLLPTLVEAAVADLHYSEQQIGILASALSVGSTLAGLLCALWIRRSSWRQAATIALFGLVLANGVAMFEHRFGAFVVLQVIVGLCGGSLYSLSLTVLADGGHPDRHFAYAIGGQTIYQIVALVAGPWLIRSGGMNAVLGLFLGLAVFGMLLIRFLPAHGRRADAAARGMGALLSLPVLLTLAGCFLFYVNIGAFWAYIERIGAAADLGLAAIANSIAFATATSLTGVLFAWWLGARRGYLAPIACSAAVIVLAAAPLGGHPSLGAFLSSNIVYSIAWNVSMTYQYSAVNAVDTSRRGVALAPSFHNAGGAAGPAIAALFVTTTDHGGVLWLVAGSVLASVGCFVLALRLGRAGAARYSGAGG